MPSMVGGWMHAWRCEAWCNSFSSRRYSSSCCCCLVFSTRCSSWPRPPVTTQILACCQAIQSAPTLCLDSDLRIAANLWKRFTCDLRHPQIVQHVCVYLVVACHEFKLRIQMQHRRTCGNTALLPQMRATARSCIAVARRFQSVAQHMLCLSLY